MEFRLLGPLEVLGESGTVALKGAKPRAVLAVLLLHANEPVSAERLAVALWGEEAPAAAVRTVQVHVSRLRKALGDGAGEIVTTTPAGYRIRVLPGELDVERFQRLVDDGHRALAAGQPEGAAAILREALSLWRGPPLADLAFEPFAQTDIARLEEEQLAALESRVEADLAAGRHADLVGELQRLVSDHPTREALAGQLILALYRCGRQSEALNAYRTARSSLVAEAGVEPGPELRRLHDAILRQDAALELGPAVPELPPQLDVATPPLVGREAELVWLHERWGEYARSGGGALVALAGTRGIGKTRLAAELAGSVHRLGADVLYASGAGPADAVDLAGRAARPTLLVVDDADRAGAEMRDAVEALAGQLDGAAVLALLCGDDAAALERLGAAEIVTLEPLDTEAVRAIAAGYAPSTATHDVPSEWLLEASGGIPGRVHELAGQWVRREAARHVGTVARRTATRRAELRSMEAELAGGVVEMQAADDRVSLAAASGAAVVCPFKGLASFEVTDAEYFFGRERLVAELVARLVGAPLLGIVGPSGSGKSSVVRAGLLPALAGGVLPGSSDWEQVVIRPGEHPANALSEAVAAVEAGRPLVLAVDQFEETFTACRHEEERTVFVEELVKAARDPNRRGAVVLAVRADYYGRCAAYRELSSLLSANQVLVRAMRRNELRRAIERPAQRAGLWVEPELTDALVTDVEDEPGALPLLSTALLELWQRHDGRRLRHVDYEHTGGVRGAVGRLAEDAYRGLEPSQRAVARSVLMRMVGAGDADSVERRRVPLAEFDTSASEDPVRAIERLASCRLLTVDAGSVEIAHEALLREWPRLSSWIEEDREGLKIRRRLTAAADEWHPARDDEALYRGARLAAALEWRRRGDTPLSRIEHDFLEASSARQRQERTARRRRIRLAFAGLLGALAAISVVAVVAVYQGREAERQRELAASRELASRATSFLAADPGLSLGLALMAIERRNTHHAQNALRQAAFTARGAAVWPAHDGWVHGVAASARGPLIATAGDDGKVRIWNADRPRATATLEPRGGPVYAIGLTPDGARVASATEDGVVAIQDVDGDGPRVLLRLPSQEYGAGLDVSPAGDRVAVAASNGTVPVVPVDGGDARVLRGHEGLVYTARFNRNGDRLVSAGADGTARVWDLLSGASMPLEHPTSVVSADFSRDGRRVATATDDGIVRIWSAGGARLGSFRAARLALYSVRFSGDGKRLLTAGEDGVVRLWDAHGGPALAEFAGHHGRVLQAVFALRGSTIMSGGEDGTLRRWSVPDVAMMRGPVNGVLFSGDGDHVITGGQDGTIRVWDLATGSARELHGHQARSYAKLSPDGASIITASLDGTARTWDLGSGDSTVVTSGSDLLVAAAADPAGERIAVAGTRPEIVIQRPGERGRVVLRGHTDDVYDAEFSSDGEHLLSASEDGTARIWNIARRDVERVLDGHGPALNSASYSPDGGQVVTGGADGTVRVWRVSDGRSVVLYGHEGPVQSAVFSPSGRRVLSAGKDGTVRVWDAAGGETLVVLYTHVGVATGADFSPDGSRVASSGEDGILRITACEVCGTIREVLELARSRADRELSAIERRRFLPADG